MPTPTRPATPFRTPGSAPAAAMSRAARASAADLLSEEERDPLGELGRRLKDRWDRIVDRAADWLQPEPEPVPVPVRWPHDGARR